MYNYTYNSNYSYSYLQLYIYIYIYSVYKIQFHIVINKNVLIYMHNYTCPESCIPQIWPEKFRNPIKNCSAVSAPRGLLDELWNKF